MNKYRYIWKGVSSTGESVNGEIFESNQVQALIKLRRQNISTIKIKRAFLSNKPSVQDKISFNYQLSTLLKAGIPLIKSLKLIGDKNPVLKSIANSLHFNLSEGFSFSEAAKLHAHFFENYECNLIEIGEKTGRLDCVIEKLAQSQDNDQKFRKKVTKAISYPCLVLIVTFFIMVGLLHYIVPEFEKTFKSFNGELPWLTLLVVSIAEKFNQIIPYIIAEATLFILFFCFALKKSSRFQIAVEKLILKIPFIRDFFGQIISIQLSRALEINLASGISLLLSLENVANVQKYAIAQNAITEIRSSILDGNALSHAVEKSSIFPKFVTQMIAIGEESGALEMIFSRISSHYESEIDRFTEQLIILLEPALMLFIGSITGTLMLALYLPIFQIGSIL